MAEKILLLFQWLFGAAFIYSWMVKGSRSAQALFFAAGFFTASAAVAVIFGSPLAALVYGAVPLAVAAWPGAVSGRSRAVAVLAVAAAALLFFGGCASEKDRLPPSVEDEIKLDFIPGRILKPAKDELFICAEREKKAVIYNTALKKEKKEIPCGYMPSDIKVKGNLVFIVNRGPGTITIHSRATGKNEEISTGGINPGSLVYDKERNLIYVANTGSNNVAVIDLTTKKILKKIPTGKWPAYLFLPPGKNLYVVCKYTNTIEIIDVEKKQHVFTQINAGTSPVKLIPLEGSEAAIISEWEYYNSQSSIIIFDRKSLQITRSINVSGGTFDALLSKSRKYLYVTDPVNDRVTVINLRTKERVAEIKMQGDIPRYIALSLDGTKLYVTCQGSKKIKVIALRSLI